MVLAKTPTLRRLRMLGTAARFLVDHLGGSATAVASGQIPSITGF